MNKGGALGCTPELESGRVHELSVSGAWVFAFLKAVQGEIMLCGRPACLEALHRESVALFCDPNRVLHTLCLLEADALWAGETALSAGLRKDRYHRTSEKPRLYEFPAAATGGADCVRRWDLSSSSSPHHRHLRKRAGIALHSIRIKETP